MNGEERSATGQTPLAPTIALSVCLALAGFIVLAPPLVALLPTTELPPPLKNHHQDAETLLFALSFTVLLPLAVTVGPRLADRIAAGPNGAALTPLVALLSTALALVFVSTKLADPSAWALAGAPLAGGGVLWAALAMITIGRASGGPWPLMTAIQVRSLWLWGVAAAAALAVALLFTTLASISLGVAAVGVLLIATLAFAWPRIEVPSLPPRLTCGFDLLVVIALALVVPNVVIFAAGGPDAAFQTAIIQFHQNFFLGPANQVLAGDAMLVETLSQYGVGSIYFLAGLFELIPIGNGTLGLIEGVLSALMFIGAYAVLRLAGVKWPLAAAAMTVAVFVGVLGLQFPLGGLLQHGAIRFGLPLGIVLGAVVEARWPARGPAARGLQLLTLAVASIWALEAFAYCLLTIAAVAALNVWAAPSGDRWGRVRSWALPAVLACLGAHLLLVAWTVIASGELPRWGWYLNTLQEFLAGPIGDVTFDFSPWGPGLALGALYFGAATALILVLRRRPGTFQADPPLITAIAGTTAFGVALFSYVLNRSADHIIAYVALPAVMLAALWLALLGRPSLGVASPARRVATLVALGVATLLISVSASTAGERFGQSALGHLRPGGAALSVALERLWDPPAINPAAAEGERLLAEEMPGERRSSLLASADLSVEILLRSGRAGAVPLGDPFEDSFVPGRHLAPLGAYVEQLSPGDRILLDAPGRATFEVFRSDPGRELSLDPTIGSSIVPRGLARLQQWVLREIAARYDLRPVASGVGGLEVAEVVERRSPGSVAAVP